VHNGRKERIQGYWHPPIRHEGVDKVTGRALYGADFQTAGLLRGRVLRSPHAHAWIKSIDTSRAEAYPGVTAKDFPEVGDTRSPRLRPSTRMLPMIDAVIVEVPNPGHPYGVRGVGETPIVTPPAAIASAIYRAIGVRMKELPMSPGRILKALGKI
jgi:CO/xanthine dehydrogenase Mo-binding subunit